MNKAMNKELSKEFLADYAAIHYLPYSKCRNCKDDLRLYKGRWYHICMYGGNYYQPDSCKRPYPMRCKKCNSRIDYKTMDGTYYDFECQRCIEDYHKGDRIGTLSKEIKKAIQSGTHRYLKFGTSCAVVLTKDGIYFEDIC